MCIIYQNKRFPGPDFVPDKNHDGTGSCKTNELVVYKDCDIDMSKYKLSEMDEAVGITWGASAIFERCVIRGAGKLFLCGCGDPEWVATENNRKVYIKDSILERFGRRGPEVQDGMICDMENCLVLDWGYPDRFPEGRAWRRWP